jgi:ABC-type Zn uptake system ZnuABC Zn-binding protein ZnuA
MWISRRTHGIRNSYYLLAFLMVGILVSSGCSQARSTTPELQDQPHTDPDPAHSVWLEEGYLVEPERVQRADLNPGEKLRVVVSTNIVADVVANVGGDEIELTALIPQGADPHVFEPTPQDYVVLADAHIVMINGVGLEESLHAMLEQASQEVPIVSLSGGADLIQFGFEDEGGSSAGADDHQGADPHVWFDPRVVIHWVDRATLVLSTLDPAHTASFEHHAQAYTNQLETLDGWIWEQVAQIEAGKRQVVTDHLALSYFARRYGFQMVGAVIPAYSTAAQSSAREVAELVDLIRELGVNAVFVSNTANPSRTEQIASDTGVQVVALYIGSLSGPEGPAGTYLDFMKYNVDAIVEALRP